jgi:predicted glycoside hydrolase/deacetylase ChbG (UPF0249 family)
MPAQKQQTDNAPAAANGKVRVATRGDDLGTNPTTNRAFQEACLKGLLRNAGILAPAPYVEQAAEMMAHEKSICFGLHSAMLAEWDTMRWGPVAPREKVPSLLAPDGNFFKFGDDLFHHHPSHDEIFVELQAQLDKARKLGFDVKYVDAHMGWTWVLKENGDRFFRWAEKEHLVCRVRYERMPEVNVEGDRVERLMARLAAAKPGLYMYGGHPSYDNEEMQKLGHRGYEAPKPSKDREWERLIFTDPRIMKFVAERGIDIVRQDEV